MCFCIKVILLDSLPGARTHGKSKAMVDCSRYDVVATWRRSVAFLGKRVPVVSWTTSLVVMLFLIPGGSALAMTLRSTAFEPGQAIPEQYTCKGADRSPQLQWTGVPEATASIVLVCYDPDAPVGVWDHWLLYNIPAETSELPEGVSSLPEGTLAGKNSWGRQIYGGPCPPSGIHRYYFKTYALDCLLDLPEGAGKQAVMQSMKGHILDQAELMGTFSKQ